MKKPILNLTRTMKFGIRYCLLLLWVFLTVLTCSRTAHSNGCESDITLIVVDRTSVMNEKEKRALARGFERVSENAFSMGEVELVEISGESVGYTSEFRHCVTPSRLSDLECAPSDDQALSVLDRLISFAGNIFEGDNVGGAERGSLADCYLEFNALSARRAEAIEAVRLELARVQNEYTPTARTDVMGTLVELMASRCRSRNCDFVIFSNLIDRRFKEIESTDVDFTEAGSILMRRMVEDREIEAKVDGVVIWGFGFTDRDSDLKPELDGEVRSKLVAFWRGAFSEITDGKVYFSFDLSIYDVVQ